MYGYTIRIAPAGLICYRARSLADAFRLAARDGFRPVAFVSRVRIR